MTAFLKKLLRGIALYIVILAFFTTVMFAMTSQDLDTLLYYLLYAVVSIAIGLIFGIQAYIIQRAPCIDRNLRITCALSVVAIVTPLAAVTLSSVGSWAQRGMEHFRDNIPSQMGIADQTIGLILFLMACGILASGWYPLKLLTEEIISRMGKSHRE